MSLLSLDHVSKLRRRGSGEQLVLRDVCLEVDAGELVAIWGMRRSGRSTLLRVAAGVEAPDSGSVRFDGRDLAKHGGALLGGQIAYCRRSFAGAEGASVLEQIVVGQLARGVTPGRARKRAWAALERCGASSCAPLAPHELDSAETVRAAIARALVGEPDLLVIDEPTKGVDLLERDPILALVRSLADDGIAVLASATDAMALAGAERALALSEGCLRGEQAPRLADVLPLRRRATA